MQDLETVHLRVTSHGRESHAGLVTELSRREREMALLICRCLPMKEIASTMGLTAGTVKVNCSRIYEKMGVHTRCEAAQWVRAHPLLNRNDLLETHLAGKREWEGAD